MSKSVSGHEVEDMLSSVRRLVSAELPRNLRTRTPEGPGALVLTEAQRIAPAAAKPSGRSMSLEDRISELEAAVSDSTEDWEPDGSEDQSQHRPDRIVFKRAEQANEPQEPRRRSLRLSEIALIETGPANEASEPDVSDANVASFKHETDEVERAPDVLHLGTPVDDGETTTSADADVEQVDEVQDNEADALTNTEIFAPVDVLSETVSAELSNLVAQELATDDGFDQALAEAVGAGETDQYEIENAAEPGEAEDVDAHEAKPDQESDEARSASAESAALEPIIKAMIREELQGELGERITRNVRKLVRQEVQRALAVREIE